MEESEITALVQRISAGDPTLTKLQLNHACLGPAQTSWLLNEILPSSGIVELQLQQNYLGSEGVTALLSAMDNLKQLRAMDLRFNHLNAADIKRIWRKMQQNFTLEDVRIDEDLGDEDEVPFQIVVGAEAAEADGLTWSTFSKSNLAQLRTRILELLAANRRIAEVRPSAPQTATQTPFPLLFACLLPHNATNSLSNPLFCILASSAMILLH